MNRTLVPILAFALAAGAATVFAAFAAYVGVRGAFEREFGRRLGQLADMAASQISADDLADVRRMGSEGTGFLTLQAQLDVLCATSGLTNLAVVDSARRTLYDVRDAETRLGEPSPYDSLAPAALAHALAGRSEAAPAFRSHGRSVRAALSPVRDRGRVVAAMVAEAAPAWEPDLAWIRRDLVVIVAVSLLAIAALAAVLVQAAGSRLALERRLTRAENLAAMGRMTATLAHEIKNPLAIIRGSARRLSRGDDETARLSASVVEEVDRLSRTVNRYLQFARVESPAADTRGDAVAALAATLDLLEDEARERGCALEREGEFAPALVRLDAESLKQVFLNLVLNAIEAQPNGGRVLARVARTADRVTLRIEDHGPGVPSEVLARLGEPFFTTRAQGTGLGLFLSRRLVRSAGGTLGIESRPGAGTACVVDLPLAPR